MSRSPAVTIAALVIAGLGAALLFAGSVSRSWWEADRGASTYSVGPVGFEFCQQDLCRKRGLGDNANPNPARLGAAVIATSVLAVLLIAVTLGMAAGGRLGERTWLPKSAALASLFAGALGAAFAFIRTEFGGLVAAPALYCFFFGAGVCAVAMMLLASRTAREA